MPPIRHVCTLLLIKNWDKEGFTIKQTGGNLLNLNWNNKEWDWKGWV